jgi:hypothetical protein
VIIVYKREPVRALEAVFYVSWNLEMVIPLQWYEVGVSGEEFGKV